MNKRRIKVNIISKIILLLVLFISVFINIGTAKADELSSDASLADIRVEKYGDSSVTYDVYPGFPATGIDYYVDGRNTLYSINFYIIPTPTDENATTENVLGALRNDKYSDCEISVTAQDGTVKVYKIRLIKDFESTTLSGGFFRNKIPTLVTKTIRPATDEEYNLAKDTLTSLDIVSADDSPFPTYAWLVDGQDFVYYSQADTIYMNPDSYGMFMHGVTQSNIERIDISGLDSSRVLSMGSLFRGHPHLTEIDISTLDTSNVTDMRQMFAFDYTLKKIYVGDGWNLNHVTQSTNMFFQCYDLIGYNGTRYDENSIEVGMAVVDTPSTPGYLTRVANKGETHSITYPNKVTETLDHNTVIELEGITTPKVVNVDITLKYHDGTPDDVFNNAVTVSARGYLVNGVHHDENTDFLLNTDTVVEYDQPTISSLTLPTPVRNHATFLGWYTEEEGGEQVTTADESITELHAHWDDHGNDLTYDFNINKSFDGTVWKEYDTGYALNWEDDFTIEETFSVPELGQNVLLFGSYNNCSSNYLNVTITAEGKLKTSSNSGSSCMSWTSTDTISANTEYTVRYYYNYASKTYTLTLTGDGVNISRTSTNNKTGTDANTMMLYQNHSASSNYAPINITNFKITVPEEVGTVISEFPEADHYKMEESRWCYETGTFWNCIPLSSVTMNTDKTIYSHPKYETVTVTGPSSYHVGEMDQWSELQYGQEFHFWGHMDDNYYTISTVSLTYTYGTGWQDTVYYSRHETDGGWDCNGENYPSQSTTIVTENLTCDYAFNNELIPAVIPQDVEYEDWEFLGWYNIKTGERYTESTYEGAEDLHLVTRWDDHKVGLTIDGVEQRVDPGYIYTVPETLFDEEDNYITIDLDYDYDGIYRDVRIGYGKDVRYQTINGTKYTPNSTYVVNEDTTVTTRTKKGKKVVMDPEVVDPIERYDENDGIYYKFGGWQLQGWEYLYQEDINVDIHSLTPENREYDGVSFYAGWQSYDSEFDVSVHFVDEFNHRDYSKVFSKGDTINLVQPNDSDPISAVYNLYEFDPEEYNYDYTSEYIYIIETTPTIDHFLINGQEYNGQTYTFNEDSEVVIVRDPETTRTCQNYQYETVTCPEYIDYEIDSVHGDYLYRGIFTDTYGYGKRVDLQNEDAYINPQYPGGDLYNFFAEMDDIIYITVDGEVEIRYRGWGYLPEETEKADDEFTITFDYNDNETSSLEETVVTSYELDYFDIEEYSDDNKYQPEALYDFQENITLTSIFTSSYTYPNMPTVDNEYFVGWYTQARGGQLVTTLEGITAATTLYAHYNDPSKTAYLKTGENINLGVAMNHQVTGALRRATLEEYNNATLTSSNIISTDDSPNVVYMWSADNNILYYTEAEKMYMNENSYRMFSDLKVTSIDLSDFDSSLVTNMNDLFERYKGTSIDVSSLNTSNVTTMYGVFWGAENLETIEGLENFDTRNVTSMSEMFYYCESLKTIEGLENFDTRNVTNMDRMFYGCTSLEEIDLSGFDTSASPSTNNMFDGATSLRSVYVSNKWDNTKIGNSTNMFENTHDLIGYYGFEFVQGGNSTYHDKTYARVDTEDPNNRGFFTDVSHKGEMNTVTYPDGTVEVYPHNSKIYIPTNDGSKPNKKVAEITFKYHDDITADTTIDVEKVYYKNGWYVNNEHYWNGTQIVVGENLLLEYGFSENITRVESFPRPEREGYSFTGWWTDEYGGERIYNYAETEDITLHAHWSDPFAELDTGYNVNSKINGISYTDEYGSAKYFRKATEEEYNNLDKDTLDDYYNIISNEDSGELIYAWNAGESVLYYSKTDNILLNEDSSYMFSYSAFEEIDLSGLDPSNVTNMENMFQECYNLTNIVFGDNFDTSSVTDMSMMFAGCYALQSVDFSKLDTSNVTDMSYMFYNCGSLTTFNFDDLDTSSATDMGYMFAYDYALTTVDMSKANLSSLTNAGGMFYYCTSLSNFTFTRRLTSNITDIIGMFEGCSSLEELSLVSLDTSNIQYISSMFYGMTNLRTIYVSDYWDTSNLSYGDYVFYDDENIVGEKGTTFDSDHIDVDYAIVDDAPDHPGYLTHADVYTVTYPDGSIELYRDGETLTLGVNNYTDSCSSVLHVWLDYNIGDGGDPAPTDVCVNSTGNGWKIDDVHYDDGDTLTVRNDIYVTYDTTESVYFPLPQNIEHEDWEFLGWYVGDTKWEKEYFDELADAIFVAHWSESLPTDFDVDSENITMVVGDTHQIVVTFTPDGTEDIITYTEYDNEKINIVDGLITAITKGETTITIGTENTDIEKTITVTIVSDKLESEVYDVREEDIDAGKDRVIVGAEPLTTIGEFKDNLLNPNEYIKIYDSEGNELDDDAEVRTGLVIKLEYGSNVVDEAIMVIRGDIDGDGVVSLADYMAIINHYVEIEEITSYPFFLAADVDEDEILNMADALKLMNYYAEIIDTLND